MVTITVVAIVPLGVMVKVDACPEIPEVGPERVNAVVAGGPSVTEPSPSMEIAPVRVTRMGALAMIATITPT